MFLLWELVVHLFAIPSFFLPPPSDVFVTLWTNLGPIIEHALITLYETLGGFALATVIGTALGVALGASQLVHYSTYPSSSACSSCGSSSSTCSQFRRFSPAAK